MTNIYIASITAFTILYLHLLAASSYIAHRVHKLVGRVLLDRVLFKMGSSYQDVSSPLPSVQLFSAGIAAVAGPEQKAGPECKVLYKPDPVLKHLGVMETGGLFSIVFRKEGVSQVNIEFFKI